MAKRKPIGGNMSLVSVGRALPTIPYAGLVEGFEDAGDTPAVWSTTGSGSNIQASVTHAASGELSLSFDKVAGSTDAGVEKTLDSSEGLDLSDAGHLGKIIYYVFPTTAIADGLTAVQLRLGTDDSNYFQWETLVAALTNGDGEWNIVEESFNIPDSQVGNGMDYDNITYIAINTTWSLAGDTTTDLLIDSFYIMPEYNTA